MHTAVYAGNVFTPGWKVPLPLKWYFHYTRGWFHQFVWAFKKMPVTQLQNGIDTNSIQTMICNAFICADLLFPTLLPPTKFHFPISSSIMVKGSCLSLRAFEEKKGMGSLGTDRRSARHCANTDRQRTAVIPTCNSLFPLHLNWTCLNSWKKSEQRGKSVCTPHRQTPAGCGRLKSRGTDYPIHHFMLILMEVNKHMCHKARLPTGSKSFLLTRSPIKGR